jgi:hypothetical protein
MEETMKTWKVALLAAALAIIVAGPVLAQNAVKGVTTDVHAEKGDFNVLGGIGYGWRGFGVSGGVEYIFQKFDIPGFPLTMGVMGLAGLDFGSCFDVSAAGMATLHWGLKAYKDFPEFLRKFAWYMSLGLGVGIIHVGFGMSSGGGVSYYVNEKLAIDLHSFYVNHFVGGASGVGGTIGIRYKL